MKATEFIDLFKLFGYKVKEIKLKDGRVRFHCVLRKTNYETVSFEMYPGKNDTIQGVVKNNKRNYDQQIMVSPENLVRDFIKKTADVDENWEIFYHFNFGLSFQINLLSVKFSKIKDGIFYRENKTFIIEKNDKDYNSVLEMTAKNEFNYLLDYLQDREGFRDWMEKTILEFKGLELISR